MTSKVRGVSRPLTAFPERLNRKHLVVNSHSYAPIHSAIVMASAIAPLVTWIHQ